MTPDELFQSIRHRIKERVMGHDLPAGFNVSAYVERVIEDIVKATIIETLAELERQRDDR